MNGEVSVLVDQVNDVIAVPNDAVKSVREAAVTGQMLGLNPDSVTAEVRAQMVNGGGFGRARSDASAGGTPAAGAAAPANARVSASQGDVALAPQGEQRQDRQQGDRQGRQQIDVTDKQCADVRAALTKKPAAQKKLDDLRTRSRSGEIDFNAMRDESQKIYASLGVDPRVAGACRRREMSANGGGQMAGATDRPSGGGGGAQRNSRAGQSGSQSPTGRNGLQLSTPEMGGVVRHTRSGLVFVSDSAKKTYHPRVVLLGASNFDYTEVVTGLKEGERVALLTSLALQAQRQQQNDRMRQGMGVPGLTPNAGGGPGGGPGRGGAGGAATPPRGGGR
jgi:HlyD family secretion protein